MSAPVNPLDYAEVIDRVSRYYNASADEMWSIINQYNLAPADLYGILPEAHQAVYAGSTGAYTAMSAAGTPMYQAFNAPVPSTDGGVIESVINSNMQTGTAAGTFNSSFIGSAEAAGDTVTFSPGATQYIGGQVGGRVMAVAGKVLSSIGIVAAGAALGKGIDSLIYNANPDYWDSIGLSSLNPATWDSITADLPDSGAAGLVKRGINTLLHLDPTTKKTTAYMEKDALDYFAYVLAQNGFFDTAGQQISNDLSGGYYSYQWQGLPCALIAQPYRGFTSSGAPADRAFRVKTNTDPVYFTAFGGNNAVSVMAVSRSPFTLGEYKVENPSSEYTRNSHSSTLPTPVPSGFNRTQYYYELARYNAGTPEAEVTPHYSANDYFNAILAEGFKVFWLGTVTENPTIPGVSNQPDATIPNISSNDTQEDVTQKVHGALPDLMNNRIVVPTLQPDGTIQDKIYIPVPLPNGQTEGQPLVDPTTNPQLNPSVTPESEEDPIALILKLLLNQSAGEMPQPQVDPETGQPTDTPPDTPNPPDVGGGITPPIVVPSGSASALWAVYNPTQAELNSLGAWLWSNNFVDQLLKMFNDPMQAIIGLHKTFIPPVTGAKQDIKVGYLNSGVSSLTVPVQYSCVDCGSVDCAEYFGNVFDYSPYTRIYIYLPFIGFKELDVAQVMRGRISVKYYGDAFTGACLAEISVIRDNGAGGVLYTYSGDCAAKYPLSHGSYMGIVNAIAGIGIGIGTALAGAPSIGVAGAVGMAQHARANVEHSGGFSGNSGAMGIKKPYLVIMRPQTAMANNYEHFTGQPSNSNVVLGSAIGYVRVKECHVEDITTATDAEKQMIESALKTGVII